MQIFLKKKEKTDYKAKMASAKSETVKGTEQRYDMIGQTERITSAAVVRTDWGGCSLRQGRKWGWQIGVSCLDPDQ